MERSRRCGPRSHFPGSHGFRRRWRGHARSAEPSRGCWDRRTRHSRKWPGARDGARPWRRGRGDSACARDSHRDEARAAGRPHQRSGDRGLHLRCARSAARIERGRGAVRRRSNLVTGTVSQKRLKRDIGEIAWAIPAITDVQNTITIAPRRRSRAQNRDTESTAVPARKPA